jgi:hypothetical protein
MSSKPKGNESTESQASSVQIAFSRLLSRVPPLEMA